MTEFRVSAVTNKSHLGSGEEYSWDNPGWRAFFTIVADKLIALTGAKRVLDVGCARGLLVQALANAGVDAHGTDISDSAVGSAHADVRGRLAVATAVRPIEDSWDLVTCIEVVQHMSPNDADQAIGNMCAVSERVLFSSGPSDNVEPTELNVRPTADWAAAFAQRGFFRRTDVDLSYLTPWAVLFEHADLDIREVVHRYETYADAIRSEVLDKRAAQLDAHQSLSRVRDAQQATEITDLKRRLLTLRDHAIGAEATVGTALAQVDDAVAKMRLADERVHDALTELVAVKQSQTWRAGKVVLSPVVLVRRIFHRR